MPARKLALLAAIALTAATATSVTAAQHADAAVSCDRVASPSGSDSAAGTEQAPFLTALKLVNSLSAGQTGCLRAGTYSSDNEVKIATAGVTLASYPGERATLVTRLWVARGADGATVQDLNLNGRNAKNLPSPTVNANSTVFRNNDVTNDHTTICFNLGSTTWGTANDTVIEGNKIHDCGRLPATNHDHGIYVAHADRTVIRDNWIYDNADRGIQLYPDADGGRITGNVIDGNGQGILFSGSDGESSSDNLVEGNVITNSNIRYNVESYYSSDTPVGTGNVVRGNCIHGGVRDDGDGSIQDPQKGFTATDNLIVDPLYVDRKAKDFRLQVASPCADLLSGLSVPVDGTSSTSETTSEESGATSEEPVITLKPKKRKVRRGRRVTLRGKANVDVKKVFILKKKRGGWRKAGRAKLRPNDKFRARARVRGKRKTRFRAETKAGPRSKPVRIKIRRR